MQSNHAKIYAKCKVTTPKRSKYCAKWQILVPNCCKYKANGTRKESQKKHNLSQKKYPKTILNPITNIAIDCSYHWMTHSYRWSRSEASPGAHGGGGCMLYGTQRALPWHGKPVIRSDLDKHIWVNMIKSWNLAQNPTKRMICRCFQWCK